MALSRQTIKDANLPPLNEEQRYKFGCIIANQYGVVSELLPGDKLRLIKQMPHMVAALVSIEHGIKGHISAPNASSAGSAAAIGEAYRLIRDGYMERVLVGGLDFNCD